MEKIRFVIVVRVCVCFKKTGFECYCSKGLLFRMHSSMNERIMDASSSYTVREAEFVFTVLV